MISFMYPSKLEYILPYEIYHGVWGKFAECELEAPGEIYLWMGDDNNILLYSCLCYFRRLRSHNGICSALIL